MPCSQSPRDAPFVQRAGAEILDQHVVVRDQLAEQRLAVGLAQVERDAPLVAVGDLPPQRHAVLVRREPPQRIAGAGHFHLQHFRAEIGEQGRGKGAGDHGRDVEHAEARERAGGFGRCLYLS